MTIVLSNLLANGNYRASLGGQSVDFFVLAGDFNRDRVVDFSDLLTLAQKYGGNGRTNTQGDVNYDGTIDFADLLSLAQNYGQSSLASASGLAVQKSGVTRRSNRVAVALS